MASALDMPDVDGKCEVRAASGAELLASLEASSATATVWLETEIGVGRVVFHQGKIVVAEVGPLRRRTALLHILTMAEGTYSVDYSAAASGPAIVPSVDAALQTLSDRQNEWRALCKTSPSMNSILRLNAAGRQARRESTGTEHIVYVLVDGRRSIMDILGESELDPIEALRTIVRGVEAGNFDDIDNSSSLLPLPIQEISGEVVSVPSAPLVPRFQASTGGLRRAADLAGVRHGTLVGMGDDLSSWSPPPSRPDGSSSTIAASPIIELDAGGVAAHAGAVISASGANAVISLPEYNVLGHAAVDDALSTGAISEPADSLLGSAIPSLDGVPLERSARVRQIGRYEVIQRIGRGGMGSVYLARLTAKGGFRRLFALKLLRSYLASDNAATEAFLAEARLAGQLHHPNVVSVVDAGVHQQQVYLVMDYVEGCSLKQLMTAHPDHRPPRLIVPIILGALDGLMAVHNLHADDGTALNVVHCDISPENLLVGADGICRLTDFGVARRAQLARPHNVHGKPGYVAPEQVTGGAIDQGADIFAMGVVLWSALTGERLFLGSTVEETLQQVCSQPIPPPSAIGLRPPPVFDSVCLKALERDPSRRYRTAEQMQLALREAAMKEGVVGLNSEVASWVRQTVGPQLTQRRLLVLEASRPREFSASEPHPAVDADAHVGQDPRRRSVSSSPPSIRGQLDWGDDPASRTIPLDSARMGVRVKQLMLVLAAVVAALMVLVAIVWPAALTRLFSMESSSSSDRVGVEGLSVGVPNVAPTTPPRIGNRVTVAPVVSSSETPASSSKTPGAHPTNSKEQ